MSSRETSVLEGLKSASGTADREVAINQLFWRMQNLMPIEKKVAGNYRPLTNGSSGVGNCQNTHLHVTALILLKGICGQSRVQPVHL